MIPGRVVLTSKPKSIVRHTDYTIEVPHAGFVEAHKIKELLSRVPDDACLFSVDDGEQGLTLKFQHSEAQKL